jgi:peptidyl-tRNA hydrolase
MLIKRLLNIPPLLEQFQGMLLTLFKQVSLPGLTRISLGIENCEEDVDTLIHVLDNIARQPQAGVDRPFASMQTDVQQQMDGFAEAAAQSVYN